MSDTANHKWRCYDCGVIIETKDQDGPVCPNGHASPRIVRLGTKDSDEMLADLDAYNLRHDQEAARAQQINVPVAAAEEANVVAKTTAAEAKEAKDVAVEAVKDLNEQNKEADDAVPHDTKEHDRHDEVHKELDKSDEDA